MAVFPTIELQMVAQAEDPPGIVQFRPVLMDSANKVAQAMETMSGTFLSWTTAPDGRRRVSKLADFLSAFCTASVLDDTALTKLLDGYSIALLPLVERISHLLGEGSLAIEPYPTRGELFAALSRATFLRRGDLQMSCTVTPGLVVAEAYINGDLPGMRPGQAGDDEDFEDADAVVVPGRLGYANYLRAGVFSDCVNEFNIPDTLHEFYYLFGATATNAMRTDPSHSYQRMARTVHDTLRESHAISLTPLQSDPAQVNPMTLPSILQWLRDNTLPRELDTSSLLHREVQRSSYLLDRVKYFQGPDARKEVISKQFKMVCAHRLPTLGSDRWLGNLTSSEAYEEYRRLAKVHFPNEDADRFNTMRLVDEVIAGDAEMWNKPSFATCTGSSLVSALVRQKETSSALVKDTAQKSGDGGEGAGSGGLNKAELKRAMEQIRNVSFEHHATRLTNIHHSSLSHEDKCMSFLKATLAIPRRPDGSIDEASFHILIPQTLLRPRLTVVHHEVFGLMEFYREHIPRYLTQYAMHGSSLGVSTPNPAHKFHVLPDKITTALIQGRWAEIDYLNECQDALQAMLDECQDTSGCHSRIDQYGVKSHVDDVKLRMGWLHESIGIVPGMANSTEEILELQKKIIDECTNIPKEHRKRVDTAIQDSFVLVLREAGKHWRAQLTSKDPTITLDRALGTNSRTVYDGVHQNLRDLLSSLKPLLRYMPNLLSTGEQVS